MTSTPPLQPIGIFPQTPPPLSLSTASTSTPNPIPISSPSAVALASLAPLQGDTSSSPPPTPTPLSSSSTNAAAMLLLSSSRMRAISPPTPAPSPQPHALSGGRFPSLSSNDSAVSPISSHPLPPGTIDWGAPLQPQSKLQPCCSLLSDGSLAPCPLPEDDLVSLIRSHYALMSPSLRQKLMTQLLADSSPSLLSPLLPLIQPRLKRDFLKTLPLELAFHVLSFVDDVRTLARASGVSRFWRALLEDEGTWRRMCWKSGFGSAGDAEEGSSRIRTLEFGEREEEDGTPAGRERRGTLDRESLREFAARAELFGLRPGVDTVAEEEDEGRRSAHYLEEELESSRGTMTASSSWVGVVGAEQGSLPDGWEMWDSNAAASSSSAAASSIPSAPLHYPLPTTIPGGLGFPNPITSRPLTVRTSANSLRRPRVVDHNPAPIAPFNVLDSGAISAEIQEGPTREATVLVAAALASASLQTTSSDPLVLVPSSRRPSGPSTSAPTSPRASTSLSASVPPSLSQAQGYRSAPAHSPALPSASGSSTPRKPFSYKTHFKRAYLTESAWLRGPGRMLSTQQSADDVVVTSLGFDGEWIVVGMATSKVHVFDAANGAYVKTLDGHDLGVWCLTLVSKGGGPREEDLLDSRTKASVPTPHASSSSSTPNRGNRTTTAAVDDATSRLFTNDSPTANSQFFRHPRPGSSGIEPSTETGEGDFGTSPTADFESTRPRRKSFHAFDSRSGNSGAGGWSGARTGGMGLGAGGETGDSGHQAGVCGTARGWGQKGAVVVSGGCDRDVRVWDVESGTCTFVLRGHTSTVRCMRVIEGRPIAVSGSRDATLRVWNIETGQPLHLLAGHEHSVRCIEVSGNKVVSGSYDATCRLWDVDTGQCLHVFRGHIHQIYAVAFDGIRVVTGSLDSTVRVWSATTGEFLALLQGHTSLVGQLQLDPVSNVLVTGGSDGRVIVFNLATFETRHRICAHDNSVTCLQFDDRFLVTGGNDGRIILWDFQTGAYIRDIGEPCEAVWRVTFRDDKCVILCRKEGKTMMDVKTFRPSEAELHGN
ncbi:WD40 repeat-like protein [Meredithblackwellia eburnea MCA 4105]